MLPVAIRGSGMDAAGAQELRRRLDAQAHWRQAEAVLRGLQPRADPDADALEEIRDGLRLYRPDCGAPPAKRLVDGGWEWTELPDDDAG